MPSTLPREPLRFRSGGGSAGLVPAPNRGLSGAALASSGGGTKTAGVDETGCSSSMSARSSSSVAYFAAGAALVCCWTKPSLGAMSGRSISSVGSDDVLISWAITVAKSPARSSEERVATSGIALRIRSRRALALGMR